MEQLSLLQTPEEHARLLHPDAPGVLGLVTLAFRDNGKWQEIRLGVDELGRAVRRFRNRPDVYLTQNRFWGPRRVAALAQLDALWADLDAYKVPGLEEVSPGEVLKRALGLLSEAGIPEPSFAFSSGRGLALVWLHTPVPRMALPRWNACQRRLYEVLSPLGADPVARDAARVLRLVGTRNGKNGALVEALTEAKTPWTFDALADRILPVPRAVLRDLRVQRALRRGQGRLLAPPPREFTQASLWEARLADLERLLELRQWRPLPPGHRDTWLFLAGVAMSWLAEPQVLERELLYLAERVGGWSEPEARSRLWSIFDRVQRAARGERVTFQGREVDPRYRFRTETIIEWLGITPEEERHLQTLISRGEKRRRHREDVCRARREAGVQEREAWMAGWKADRAKALEERRRRALELAKEGHGAAEIARLMGVARSTVYGWLRADGNFCVQ